MRRIVSATPLPKHRLALRWATGESAEIDLAPLFRRGVFATVRGARAFATVEVGDRGRSVFWRDSDGDELDLCADALWSMAFEHTSAAAE